MKKRTSNYFLFSFFSVKIIRDAIHTDIMFLGKFVNVSSSFFLLLIILIKALCVFAREAKDSSG